MIKKIKLNVKLLLKIFRDIFSGLIFQFGSSTIREISYSSSIKISQRINQSDKYENKIFNLKLASSKINKYHILPNQIFSFWNIIGNPNKDFLKSRAILNGSLIDSEGGGLCQVSGIIYYVALVAGLEVLERYNHSLDIYNDSTRYTPLGTDATVVYGYKDLRIKNNFSFPIKFKIDIIDNQLTVELMSTSVISESKLIFEEFIADNFTLVKVYNENKKLLNVSKYSHVSHIFSQ
jgi:vancomycin resistance protein VanW